MTDAIFMMTYCLVHQKFMAGHYEFNAGRLYDKIQLVLLNT